MFESVANTGHALRELQGKKTSVVSGAAAATNIALTGVAPGDTLGSVLMFAGGVPSDVTSEAAITSAGNIQLSTTNSTGNTLVVEWYPTASSM